MSSSPTDTELASQLELARLEAELAEAKARAAQAQLEAAKLRAHAARQQAATSAVPAQTPIEQAPVAQNTSAANAAVAAADGSGSNGRNGSHAAAAVQAPAVQAPAVGKPAPKQRSESAAVKPAPAAVKAPEQTALPTAPAVATKSTAAQAEPPPSEEIDKAEPAVSRRRWLSRKVANSFGSWSLSMIVHMAVLILMALWILPAVITSQPPLIDAVIETPEEVLNQVLDERIEPSTELSVASPTFTGLAQGHAANIEGASSEPTFDREVSTSVEGPAVKLGDVDLVGVKSKDLGVDVPYGAPGDARAIVDNYDQAMDRITQEILMMLIKNKVLVVWLFDESESMKDDQVEIKGRIERVYQELGLTTAAHGDNLMTAVCSFGEKWTVHTKNKAGRPEATYDLDEIRKAIEAVPSDPSGKEMLCSSVGATVQAYSDFASRGRRQLALIVVTDESGEQKDNLAVLEPALQEAKAARCRIYTLGREAIFGYPYAFMNWTDPATKYNYWLQIDRGPETPAVEQLQTNGFYRRNDAHASGFGPYEQTRLSRETGGIFFMLPSPEVRLVHRDSRKYELEKMRPYMPDLSPRDQYVRERDAVDVRKEVYKVIEKLNPYNAEAAKHINMRHHFSIDKVDFDKQVKAELVKAEAYVRYLHDREKELEAYKSRRDNDPNPRWRANYDLILAQIIAYKVRIYEYGAYLEDFMKDPAPIKNPRGIKQKTTHWELAWRKETLTGEKTAAYIVKATELFNNVIKDHPGTPWSARAQDELARGFGIRLVEDYDPPDRYNNVKLPKL